MSEEEYNELEKWEKENDIDKAREFNYCEVKGPISLNVSLYEENNKNKKEEIDE